MEFENVGRLRDRQLSSGCLAFNTIVSSFFVIRTRAIVVKPVTRRVYLNIDYRVNEKNNTGDTVNPKKIVF